MSTDLGGLSVIQFRKIRERRGDQEEYGNLINRGQGGGGRAALPIQEPPRQPSSFFGANSFSQNAAPPVQSYLQPAQASPMSPRPSIAPAATDNSRTFSSPPPPPISSHVPPSEDILSKLRFAEEQLQSERRARGWLEAELQLGKTLLSTLSAKVDRLQETVAADSVALRDATRAAGEGDRRARDAEREVAVRLEREFAALHRAVADVAARQKHDEQAREEDLERHRAVGEELGLLRYKVEAGALRTAEVGNEVHGRAREMEFEMQRGAEALRRIADHDHALEALRALMEASAETVAKRVDMAHIETKQRLDTEARARQQFEAGTRDLYGDVRKVLANQEREFADRLDGVRMQVQQTVERERQEREKGYAGVLEQTRSMERGIKDAQVQLADRVSEQVHAIDATVSGERNERERFQAQMRSDLEEGFKLMQGALAKKAEDMQQQQIALNHKLELAAKALHQSLLIVDKGGKDALDRVEAVLKAEIQQRLLLEERVNVVADESIQKIEVSEKKSLDAVEAARQDIEASISKLEEDLTKTSEHLASSKARSVGDLESQIASLRKRFKEGTADAATKLKTVEIKVEQMKSDQDESIAACERRMEERVAQIRTTDEETLRLVHEVELKCTQVQIDVEERLNVRSVQMDQALDAMRDELTTKCSVKDAEECEERVQASVASLQAGISQLVMQISDTRDTINACATRQMVDEVELRAKTAIGAVLNKVVLIDEALIAGKEEMAIRATKREMGELEDRIRSSLSVLQIRDVEIDERVDRMRDEILERCTKKGLLDAEERLREQMVGLAAHDIEIAEALTSLKDSVSTRATKADFAATDTRISDLTDALTMQLEQTNTAVESAKEELSRLTQDDMADMAAQIEARLVALQTRADSLDTLVETVRLRISDTEVTLRERLREHTRVHENMMSDHRGVIEEVRETAAEALAQVTRKVDDVPRQLHAFEAAQKENRRWLDEKMAAESDRNVHMLTEMREVLAAKVSETDFDRLQGEITSAFQKLGAQLEISAMGNEQLKQRVGEQEAATRERLRETRAAQERALAETAQNLRLWRETAYKRIEELDARLTQCPKKIDAAMSEVKRLRYDLDDKVHVGIGKLEKEVKFLKGEIQSRVSERGLDDMVGGIISPLNGRLDRLSQLVDDLRGGFEGSTGREFGNFNSNTMRQAGGGRPRETHWNARHVEPEDTRFGSDTPRDQSFYRGDNDAFTDRRARPTHPNESTARSALQNIDGDGETNKFGAPASSIVQGSFFKPPHRSFATSGAAPHVDRNEDVPRWGADTQASQSAANLDQGDRLQPSSTVPPEARPNPPSASSSLPNLFQPIALKSSGSSVPSPPTSLPLPAPRNDSTPPPLARSTPRLSPQGSSDLPPSGGPTPMRPRPPLAPTTGGTPPRPLLSQGSIPALAIPVDTPRGSKPGSVKTSSSRHSASSWTTPAVDAQLEQLADLAAANADLKGGGSMVQLPVSSRAASVEF
ncbi:hypothetical protein BDK51DRAFT_44607 [Blyttiomyces helicus]|uniref:Uncharacterized protein n=1 Tax=Blyttiomyces helicus TaxID=388810 RepID=A0A4P9WKR3_9FUNG|nr:hypothetical protein BDK51DRAFT_44607 [Blyttiomyces helicus]|eukprot:RKO93591.1 hypothetical protein BDK51DRAFT_44607 [Blyttiomyces helicus]